VSGKLTLEYIAQTINHKLANGTYIMGNKLNRFSTAIKTWLPLTIVAAASTFIVTSLVTPIPIDRAIGASILVALLVFGGFTFRSFGKEKEQYEQE
jgi:hypothetical protein